MMAKGYIQQHLFLVVLRLLVLYSNESISGASNKSLDTYLPIGEIEFETVFEIRVRTRSSSYGESVAIMQAI